VLVVEIRMDGRVALVTGASRGIGLAIARRFVEAGANVMLSSRKAEGLAEAADSLAGLDGEVAWHVAHVGDRQAAARCVDATIERFGRLDVLVNNAATNPHFGALVEIDEGQVRKTYEVNQEAVLAWTQLAWQRWQAEHGGVVLNVSSVGGLRVEPGLGWYNVTKAAVVHLTRQLAYELGPKVRVNAIAPGLVKTYFARVLWENFGEAVERRLPLRRIGDPDDVARVALFLASDAASWMTGAVVVVDGGASVLPTGGV
jgi:NAD(P)-dependent dehydrogenase (short-subunit alcohol dehydrogenase family)